MKKRIVAMLLTVVMLFGTFLLDIGAHAVDIKYVTNSKGEPTDEIDYEATVKQYLKKEFATAFLSPFSCHSLLNKK